MPATIRHNSVDINSVHQPNDVKFHQRKTHRSKRKHKSNEPITLSSHFLYPTHKSYSSCSILSNCLSTTINRSLILCCSNRNRARTCSLLSPGPKVGSILVSMEEREARLAPMRSSSAIGLSRSWSRSLSTSPECGRLRLWYVKSTGGGPYVWY